MQTASLTPTDDPRRLKTLLNLITFLTTEPKRVKPAFVVRDPRAAEPEFFVCDGNHRVAAAHVCRVSVECVVLANDDDLRLLREGKPAEAKSLYDLVELCRNEARERRHRVGQWDEYLRRFVPEGWF